jgi:glycerate 2-kinase
MRILIAPDKFKGSISAATAAEAIAHGLREGGIEAEFVLAPIADGGEGFAEAMGLALGANWIQMNAQDPIGREVSCRYAWVAPQKLAIIEMAEASGLWRLKPEERDPLRANTFGTGQLMRDAIERGAKKILVGLGGSATTDGGIGMAAALGYDILTSDNDDLAPIPGDLIALVRIENARDYRRLRRTESAARRTWDCQGIRPAKRCRCQNGRAPRSLADSTRRSCQ